jgi:hypothetical protein
MTEDFQCYLSNIWSFFHIQKLYIPQQVAVSWHSVVHIAEILHVIRTRERAEIWFGTLKWVLYKTPSFELMVYVKYIVISMI